MAEGETRKCVPWHDFAIELYNEEPLSATLRLAFFRGDLLVAQGEMPDGLLARFQKPDNPKALWIERSVEPLHAPHALAVSSDGKTWIAGENNGPHSRLLRNGVPARETDGLIAAFALPDRRFILAGRRRVRIWP